MAFLEERAVFEGEPRGLVVRGVRGAVHVVDGDTLFSGDVGVIDDIPNSNKKT